ncbi:MAG: DUF2058 domain-containing protein [Proteobacteria bacterium]|nr:DUF2058 domain-containing protein [Pseudomonadota bacterium]
MSSKKKSGGSLQEQLRNAGLVTDKQLRKVQKGIHRQEMRVKQGVEVDADRQAADRALADKQTRDRKINRDLNEIALAKALHAQIGQLITANRQRESGDVSYNFTDDKKIKKIFISEKNKAQLNKGFLAIVRLDDGYELVPEKIVQRIQARIPDRYQAFVVYLYDRSNDEVDEEDPYKDFQIPDDLEW